ncbi:serine protease [Thermocatellispora tengchongensis]|uniref:serine protease n=1 Tax=Thermocatellispora tengchongensis TaxID=1073253 RepID=UPI0036391DDB
MSAQPDRVVEILLDLTEPDGRTRKGYGTGYRITTGLVLTSAHLFGRAGRAAGCAVRGFGGARTASAALVLDLRDEADLAVLRLADTHGWPRVAPVRFGVLPPEGGVRFALIGWPRAAESASVRDSVELTGTIAAGANIKSGRLKLYIQGPTPRFTGTHASPWSGISGAAVFAHTALVGVVREHLVSLGVDQLDAEPLEALTDSPAFRDLLTAENATRPLVRLLPDRPPEERGPPLEAKLTRPTPAVVLNFRARATALVGREPELRRLRDFLSSDSPFRWQLLSGAGGMGKSRLALELCLEAAADGWHAGFLIPDVPFAWSSWLPARPTLIVVDEIEYRKDTVREIVRVLSARSDELTDRVRVLLLAREKAARIESLLKIEPTDWDVFFADTAAGPAIELGELDAGDAARLARDVPGGTAAPASAGSPLHTMLAALAGPGQRAWDAALIGRYVLRRNRMSYWQDMTDLDEAALAYACITRDTSDALPHSGLLPELEPAGWRELVARNHAFTGTDAPGLAPLEPGPIGELFTLDLIARAPDAESTEDLGHRVVAAAFRLNPLANEFALRCMLHYPEHQGLPRLIAAMVEEFDLSSPSPFFTGLPILIESAGQYAESGDVALAFAEAEAARLLTVRESLSLLTAGSYSELLFNLVTKFCQAGDWPAADRASP